MEKKIGTKHGVQVGDIFRYVSLGEDSSGYSFYQVIALHGKTQVVVREIKQAVIAFDGVREGVVPLKDQWWPNEKEMVRKVHCLDDGSRCIHLISGRHCYAFLDTEEMYLSPAMSRFADTLLDCQPDIAKQLDLRQGFGVFAVDRAFKTIADDCRVLVRYQDGRQEEVVLRDFLRDKKEAEDHE